MDGIDYASGRGSNILNASGNMLSTAAVGWKVDWTGGVQRSWAQLKLFSSLLGSGQQFVGIGNEFQLPAIYNHAWTSLVARIEIDVDVFDCILSFPSERYWVSVFMQDSAGAHLVYNQSDSVLVEGHHVILADMTPYISNWTAATYLIVSLHGSNWVGVKAIIIGLESWELIGTCTSTSRYVGITSSAGSNLGYNPAVSTSSWTWTAPSPVIAPGATLQLTIASDRVIRGLEADGGVFTRVEIVARDGADLVLGSCTVHDGWSAGWYAVSTYNSSIPAGTASISIKFTITMPGLSAGTGPSPADVFHTRLTSITLHHSSMNLTDLLATHQAWSFKSSSASGSITATGTGVTQHVKVVATASSIPSGDTKLFTGQLMSPTMYAETLRSKTFATLETWYTPVVDTDVPVHMLAGQSAHVTVSFRVVGKIAGGFFPIGTFMVDSFDIRPEDVALPRYAALDVSRYLGVPVGFEFLNFYIDELRVAIELTIDVANASSGDWGVIIHDQVLIVENLPPQPRFAPIPSTIHGIQDIIVFGDGDEVEMFLEASMDGTNYTLVAHATQPSTGYTWRLPFDTTRVLDGRNYTIRVIARDTAHLYSAPVYWNSIVEVDNEIPEITSVSIASNSWLISSQAITVTTNSSDVLAALFEFTPHGEGWASPSLHQYLDLTPDSLEHFVSIHDLPEGSWDLRVSLADEILMDRVQVTFIGGDAVVVAIPSDLRALMGQEIIENITIMHVTPEIVDPLPGTVSNGLLTIQAAAGTASVVNATLHVAELANNTIESAISWQSVGSTSTVVNGSFWFALTPAFFGAMERHVAFVIVFAIENGTTYFTANASRVVFIDTITPSASIDFTTGWEPDAQGYTPNPVVNLTYAISNASNVEWLYILATSPEHLEPVLVRTYHHPSSSGCIVPFLMATDGKYQFSAQVIDVAGNTWISPWLNVSLDARPLSMTSWLPAHGQRVWYNTSASIVSVPIEIHLNDCDVNTSSIHGEYRLVSNGTWMPFNGSWAMRDARTVIGTWSMNASALDAYPRYEVRVHASDRGTTASTLFDFLLVSVIDIAAPSSIQLGNPADIVIWGDEIALEIDATDDQGILAIQVWLGQPGSPAAVLGTQNLLAIATETNHLSAVINTSDVVSDSFTGIVQLHLVAVDHAFNTITEAIPVRISRQVACSIAPNSTVRTTATNLSVAITTIQTDLDVLAIMLDHLVNASWSTVMVMNDTTPSIENNVTFVGLSSGLFRLSCLGRMNGSLTSFPVSFKTLSQFPPAIFSIDDIAPTNTVLNGLTNYTRIVDGIIPLNVSSYDNSGFVKYLLRVNGTRYDLANSRREGQIVYWDGAVFLPDGEAWLTLIAVDRAGNEQVANITQIVVLDNSAPIIDAVLTNPGPTNSSLIITRDAIEVSISAHDSLSIITSTWVEIVKAGSSTTIWSRTHASRSINVSASIPLATIDAGPCLMIVHVASEAGESTIQFSMMRDLFVPAITIMNPVNGSTMVGSNFTIDVECIDDTTVTCTAWFGMPGAGGILLGGMTSRPGSTRFSMLVPIVDYRYGSIYVVARDAFGNTRTARVTPVTFIPETVLDVNATDGQEIGSPVTLAGSIVYTGSEPEIKIGAWYAPMDAPDSFVYLGASSLIQLQAGNPIYNFEIMFDTDQITDAASAPGMTSFIPVSTYSFLEGTQLWEPDQVSRLVAFHGEFDSLNAIWMVRDTEYQAGSTLSLHVLAPVIVSGMTRYVQSIPFSTTYTGASFKFIDWESGDVDGDGRCEIILVDSLDRFHIIEKTLDGYAWTITAPLAIDVSRVVIDP
ncbi:MAG: hypothetical protein GYA24_09210, partial [Candidatus Lokiarchaeota archaeon]|nr:hypothetical protein [Candidatus Lokiarchaeota archaeon]